MAINDPNYRYATQTWEADGVRTLYDIAFDGGYIRQSDVVAFSVLVDEATGLTTNRTIHTLTFLDESEDEVTGWKTAQVEITPAVAAGRRVVIFRSTEKSAPLVRYTGGSILTEKNLDLANDQSVFGIAEIMDGLNAAAISIEQQVQEVIDLNELIRNIYEQVLELLAAGGIVSVAPRVWFGEGDGTTTDFPLVGADVSEPGFYDTYIVGVGKEPDTDYTIIMGETIADTILRFNVAPSIGQRWFTVLRGYARPYTGPQPITSLNIPIINTGLSEFFVDEAAKFALIVCTNSTGNTNLTIKEIPAVTATSMEQGSYFSAVQVGSAQVEFLTDPGVTLIVPAGCVAKTRTVGATISATCISADDNTWLVSGDLAVG